MTWARLEEPFTADWRGDTLALPVAAADDVLYVTDTADFDEDDTSQRWLVIADSDPIEYTAVDEDTGAVTLAAAAGDDYEAGLPVVLWDPTVPPAGAKVMEYLATAVTDRGPFDVIIPHDKIPLAGVAQLAGASVTVEEDGNGDWFVDQILGRQPTFDGSFLDPTTLPDPVAVEAPESSPALTVHGLPNSLVVEAEPVASTTLIEYHISTTSGFTPDASTLFGEATRSLVMVVVQMPDGTPLLPDTAYYLRAVATNTAGTAPAGPEASGQLDLEAVAEAAYAAIVAGFALVGRISIGAMYLDANEGLVIPGVMTVPVDGVSLPTILMHLLARSATFEDNVNLYGTSQLYGVMRAANGIVAPTVPAAAGRSWPSLLLPAQADSGFANCYHGLTTTPAGEWVLALAFFGGALALIDAADGHQIWTYSLPAGFNPAGGVTRIGANYYTLGYDTARSSRWFVYRLDSTFAKTGEWEWVYDAASPYDPVIGNDGTDIAIASTTSNGTTRVRTFTPGTGAFGGVVVLDTGLPAHLTSVSMGAADFGATRIVVTSATAVRVHSTAGVRQTSQEWTRAGTSRIHGLHWDGTRFRHLDDTGRIWSYSTRATNQSTDVAYTWYDGDPANGPHETDEGPVTTYTRPARAWLTIDTPLPPEAGITDPGEVDKANQVRVYAGPAGGTLRLQETLAVGDTRAVVDALDTGSDTPPATNGFGARRPGNHESTATDADGPLWDFRGDGTWRAEPYNSDDQRGTVDIITGTGTGGGGSAGLAKIEHGHGAAPVGVLCSSHNSLRTVHWSQANSDATYLAFFVRLKDDTLYDGTTPISYTAWWS